MDMTDEIRALLENSDTFQARLKPDHALTLLPAAEVRRRVTEALALGVQATARRGLQGPYIEIHNGGSSYGQYHAIQRTGCA